MATGICTVGTQGEFKLSVGNAGFAGGVAVSQPASVGRGSALAV